MTILSTYLAFRNRFGEGFPDLAGYSSFDPDKIGGLTMQTPTIPTSITFPISIVAVSTGSTHWYLSQGTDDPTKQLFSLTEEEGDQDTLYLARTALNTALFPTVNADSIAAMFRNVYIYAVDSNDNGAVVDMTKVLFGA